MEFEDINIGEVVRKMEDDFNIVECFDVNKNFCVIFLVCGLKYVFNEVFMVYFVVLDNYILCDFVKNKEDIMKFLRMKE